MSENAGQAATSDFQQQLKRETRTAKSPNKEDKARTLSQEAWRRYKTNKRAVVALVLFFLIIATAIATIVIDMATNGRIFDERVISQQLHNRLAGPSLAHPMGLDEFGRDILLRVIWGIRYSLFMGALAITGSMFFGIVLGAISGYYKKVDNIIMRCVDILMAMPSVLLATAIVAALGPSQNNVIIAIGIAKVPGFARILRASVLTIKEQEFIEAARAMGASDFRIIVRYIIPNSLAPIIVHFTMGIANAILTIAILSFVGLGVQPPVPEWGAMLSTARMYIRDAWHITIMPGLAIMITILIINIIGDALRDALDPRMKA